MMPQSTPGHRRESHPLRCHRQYLVARHKLKLGVAVDNFLINQGQATRSTLTFSRVIHFTL